MKLNHRISALFHFAVVLLLPAVLQGQTATSTVPDKPVPDTVKTLSDLAAWLDTNPPVVVPINTPESNKAFLNNSLTELRNSGNVLINYLAVNGEIGRKWYKVLGIDALRAALSQQEPNLEELEKVYQKFHSHQWGLEVSELNNVANGLKDYILLRLIVQEGIDPQAGLEQATQRLTKVLKSRDNTSIADVLEFNEIMTWVKQNRQMPEVCKALDRLTETPNLQAELSDNFVLRFLDAPVDQTQQVNEIIVGTPQHGVVRTVGETTGAFVPDPNRINMTISLNAKTSGNTYAQSGRVTVSSVTNNTIYVVKSIFFDGQKFLTTPALSSVQVNSYIAGIDSPGGLVQSIASNRASEMKPQADAEAGLKARIRAESAMNDTVVKMLSNTNTRFSQFSELYRARGLFPAPFLCSTTKDKLIFKGVIKDNLPILCTSNPSNPGNNDIYVAVHQSAIMEIGKVMLSDLKADNKVFMAIAESMLPAQAFSKVKENAAKRAAEDKAAGKEAPQGYVYFNPDYPVGIQFIDNQVKVAIRIDAFQGSGDKPLQEIPMNLTFAYKIEPVSGDQVKFVQTEKPELIPRDFETGKRKLTAQETTLRNRLTGELEQLIPHDFAIKAGQLSDMIRSDSPIKSTVKGKLVPRLAQTKDGWLQLGWVITP